MINKENYEAYFLDYVEGNLNTHDTNMLFAFLEENKELKEELLAYEDISIPTPKTDFDVSSLIKTDLENDKITSTNFEEFAIANLEKQLSPEKTIELDKVSSDNENLKKELLTIKKTVLIKDESIIYEDKEDLKKTIPLFIPYYKIAGVAAVLLFITYFSIFSNFNSKEEKVISKNSNSIIKKEKRNLYKEESSIENKNNPTTETEDHTFIQPKHFTASRLAKEVSNKMEDKKEERNMNVPDVLYATTKNVDIISSIDSQRELIPFTKVNVVANYYEDLENKKQEPDFLTVKEFLATRFKKKVLKSDSEDNNINAEDFNNPIAKITNNKVSFQKNTNNKRLLSIQTKNFSFQKKIN